MNPRLLIPDHAVVTLVLVDPDTDPVSAVGYELDGDGYRNLPVATVAFAP